MIFFVICDVFYDVYVLDTFNVPNVPKFDITPREEEKSENDIPRRQPSPHNLSINGVSRVFYGVF